MERQFEKINIKLTPNNALHLYNLGGFRIKLLTPSTIFHVSEPMIIGTPCAFVSFLLSSLLLLLSFIRGFRLVFFTIIESVSPIICSNAFTSVNASFQTPNV